MAYQQALAALADPTRRAIYESLRGAARPVGEIASGFPVSRPAVSQHLRALREAGLVVNRATERAGSLRRTPPPHWNCATTSNRCGNARCSATRATSPCRRDAVPANAAAESRDTLAPIVVEVAVPCPPGRAFDYFATDIGRWWPLATHSLGRDQAATVRFEPRVGGRLIETLRDGRERVWGTVTAWVPGRQLAFTWHLDREPSTAQLVDVQFGRQGTHTRVTLTHGGWERRDDGATARENYTGGWQYVLGERYRGFCETRVTGSPLARG